MNDKMLDVQTVSTILNICPNTVRSLARNPKSPLRGVLIGRSIRIYKSSVDALLKEGERNMIEL